VKNLEGEGEIKVERRASDPSRNGVKEGDMIDFRPEEDLKGIDDP
jgi:ASC-1-like (ASCH) protein